MTAPYTTKQTARYVPVKATVTAQLVTGAVTLASAAYVAKTITSADAVVGDIIILASPQDNAGLIFNPWVSANGTITVGIFNATTSTQTISASNFKAAIVDNSVGT